MIFKKSNSHSGTLHKYLTSAPQHWHSHQNRASLGNSRSQVGLRTGDDRKSWETLHRALEQEENIRLKLGILDERLILINNNVSIVAH